MKPHKKILAKFSYPKTSWNRKFQTPKILTDHTRQLKIDLCALREPQERSAAGGHKESILVHSKVRNYCSSCLLCIKYPHETIYVTGGCNFRYKESSRSDQFDNEKQIAKHPTSQILTTKWPH